MAKEKMYYRATDPALKKLINSYINLFIYLKRL
jgi:hypothetical protein